MLEKMNWAGVVVVLMTGMPCADLPKLPIKIRGLQISRMDIYYVRCVDGNLDDSPSYLATHSGLAQAQSSLRSRARLRYFSSKDLIQYLSITRLPSHIVTW